MTASRNQTRSIVEDRGTAIVTKRYRDDSLPFETELCQRYGSSRPIVREAVKMLTAKGLLVARKRKGTAVQPESAGEPFPASPTRARQRRCST